MLLQNIAIFFQHYFGHASFPWDFGQSYYAVPYFWISAVQQGVFPVWVAQAAMGYPIFMNLQSGIFYPVFWLFASLHIPYSLHAAVILQCLHVGLGGLGMYYLLRTQGFSREYALMGAMAYQFFGGFYSNAEHPDIIRGYAFLPWLFIGLITANILQATLLTPLCVYLFFTGAYTGQAIAMLWMSGWFLIFYRANFYRYFLLGLGILLSAITILPVGLLQSEIAHSKNFYLTAQSFFTAKNFFTTFLWTNTKVLPQDISMSTVFITLPIVGLLFFLSYRELKRHMPHVLLLFLAIIMITDNSIHRLIIHLLPPLGLSRFPCADYRAYIAVVLIYFAIIALKNLREGGVNKIYWRVIIFLSVVITGVYILWPAEQTTLKISLLIISLLGFLLFIFRKNKSFVLLGILIIIDGFRVWEGDHFVWVLPHPKMPQATITFKAIPYRPARIADEKNAWFGYLTGNFYIFDYSGGDQLARQQAVQNDPHALQFVQQESRYVLTPPGDIHLKSFSTNHLTYHIDLKKPADLLENEMYFPGWHAKLSNGQVLSAVSAGAGLRGWHLPPGNYEMVTYFDMPYLKLAARISLIGLGLWVVLIRRSYKQRQESTLKLPT